MAARHPTGRLRWPSAMQLNSHRHRRGREQKDQSVICRLIFVQSVPAAGRATQDGRAGACCSFPSLWSQRRGVRLNSALRAYTKVWFVLSKGEGKTTSFVGANFTRAQLRRLPTDGTHTGPGRSIVWLTHAWRRSSQEAEIRPF